MKPASRRTRLTVLIACVLGIAVAFALYVVPRLVPREAPDYAGTVVDPPKDAPDAMLVDQRGDPAHLIVRGASLEYLFFGYTHCPDECPLALGSLARALRTLPPRLVNGIRVVFVTVDPARDTPAVMRRYLDAFGAGFIGLTGTRATLAAVWRAYGVAVNAAAKDIDHGDAIYAIDASRHVVLVYEPSTSPRDLANDARLLLAH